MYKDRLNGRTALITGASSGIGEASAHALAQDGVNVALAARREDRLESIASDLESEHDIEAHAVPTDIRDGADVESMVETTVERLDTLDVVVSNAGLSRGDDVESMTDEEYHTMQETNVDGTFYTARESLPHLRETRGNLIFIGSFAGQYPRPGNPVYAATKWWTRGFALSVEASAGDDGVAITVINPTEVRTEFGSDDGEPFAERYGKGEVTEPGEIAEAVAFAASQERSTVSELDLFRRDKFSHF